MNGLAGRLASVYGWLLRLYPRHYQSEFAEERQEVFAMALHESAAKGNRALFHLMLRELRDFPASALRANVREWEANMKTLQENAGKDHLSWFGLLLGVWPYFFLGPVLAVAPYLPRQIAQFFGYVTPVWLAVVVLFSIFGVFAGWRKDFPRWVYPYLVALFFAIVIPALNQVNMLLGGISQLNRWLSEAILWAALVGLGVGEVFLLSRIPSTRKILRDVRADWTRLSFGMMAYLAWLTGFYGGDHLPSFGPDVWLPSVGVVMGALVYLLCRSRLQRSLALIITLFLSTLAKFIFSNEDIYAFLPVLVVVLLILLPAVVELIPRRSRPELEGK